MMCRKFMGKYFNSIWEYLNVKNSPIFKNDILDREFYLYHSRHVNYKAVMHHIVSPTSMRQLASSFLGFDFY